MPKILKGKNNKEIINNVKKKFTLKYAMYRDYHFFNPFYEVKQNRDPNEIMNDCCKTVKNSEGVLYVLPLPYIMDLTVTLGAVSEVNWALEENKPVYICTIDGKSLKDIFEISHLDELMNKFNLKAPLDWFEVRNLDISSKFRIKELYPSFANPATWRKSTEEKNSKEWRKLRLKILKRDNYTCQYCGFRAEKWQIVHHINGDPNNNDEKNLETICPMCNLIHHSGWGCVVQRIVDLYKKSRCSQNAIIQITRKYRAQGGTDEEIINYLGLEQKIPFKMNRSYLKKLFGFVTSRNPPQSSTQKALSYGYKITEDSIHLNERLLSRYCGYI